MISPPNQKAPIVPRLGSATAQERSTGTPSGGRRDPATPSRVVRTTKTPPASAQLMQLPPVLDHTPYSTPEEVIDANALPLRADSTEDIAEDVALASILSRKQQRSETYDDDRFEDLSNSSSLMEDETHPSLSESGRVAASGRDKTPTPVASTHERKPSLGKQRFNADNIVKKERVGRGTFGDVFRGIDTSTGNEVAIKEIVVAQDAGRDLEKQIHTLEREIRVMQKLDHPNTVKYFGAKRHCDALHIYMEYVRGGTLASLLRSKGPLSEFEARNFTTQLLNGLAYLHGRSIIHRDLKGDNLFVDEKGSLKVGDFGTSKELATMKITNSVAGTPNFMAPEVVTCAGHSLAADVWSVGCCVVQMLSGKAPFANVDNHMAVMFAVMKGSIGDQIPPNISPLARSFIVACVKQKPEERPTCEELLRHPWLVGEVVVAESSKPTSTEAVVEPTKDRREPEKITAVAVESPFPNEAGAATAAAAATRVSAPSSASKRNGTTVDEKQLPKPKPKTPPPKQSGGVFRSPPPSSEGPTKPSIGTTPVKQSSKQQLIPTPGSGPKRTTSDLGKRATASEAERK